jgi:hypothetical protein
MQRPTVAKRKWSQFMPSYKVSFNVSTKLPINELRALCNSRLALFAEFPNASFDITNLSVTRGTDSREEQKQRLIAEQKAWIEQCGGDLIGYIKRYGSNRDEDFFGSGGEAIYAADIAQLARLEEM